MNWTNNCNLKGQGLIQNRQTIIKNNLGEDRGLIEKTIEEKF